MSCLTDMFPITSTKWLTGTSVGDGEQDMEADDPVLRQFLASFLVEPRHFILAGPDTANKTSLAFQAAVSAATRGSRVTHICTHPISKLPAPVHGMPSPQPSVMRNVDFLYFEENADLINFFANIHTKKKLPSYIIIEDILTYASQEQRKAVDRVLAKMLALLSDACHWIALHNETGTCDLLLTAPTRIKAMHNVLRQFKFHLCLYEAPKKDAIESQVSCEGRNGNISLRFQRRQKTCLMLNDVHFSIYNIRSNSTDVTRSESKDTAGKESIQT